MSTTRLAMIAALVLASAAALAKGPEHGKRELKTLTEAADALRPAQPDLAARLQAYAEKESGEMEGADADSPADVQLLKDSAAALEKIKPALAKKLRKHALKEEREHRGVRIKPLEPKPEKPAESPTGY